MERLVKQSFACLQLCEKWCDWVLAILFGVRSVTSSTSWLDVWSLKWWTWCNPSGVCRKVASLAAKNILKSTAAGKKQYDRKVRFSSIQPGDRVLVRDLSDLSDLKDGLVSLEYCTGIYCCRVICFQLTTETLPFIILKDTWLPVLRRKFETGCRRMNSPRVIQETRMNRLVCPLQSYRLCGCVHLQETLNVLRQDN